jgi:aerobic carbon-monoxide dehydrogenase large subunit
MIYSDSGQPRTASLLDYHVPIADEVPHFTLIHLTTQSPHAPHGVKGVGEGGTLAPGAAIANAVSDALRGECNALPATPQKVMELMRDARLAECPRHGPIRPATPGRER